MSFGGFEKTFSQWTSTRIRALKLGCSDISEWELILWEWDLILWEVLQTFWGVLRISGKFVGVCCEAGGAPALTPDTTPVLVGNICHCTEPGQQHMN